MYKRAQAGEGVYGVKLFDFSRSRDDVEVPEEEASIDPDVLSAKVLPHSPYSHSNKTVTVFVLDVRTHKTPWKPGTEGYELDYEGDFLGERQWQWFETAIRRSRASVNVVVNGLQVHANRFPNGNIAEAWGRFPRAQQRLFDTVLQDGVEAPILISGDVHMTQLMRKDCIRKGEPYTEARPLVEMTTSGMTHSWGTISSPRPSSRPRKRPSWRGLYKSYLKATLMTTLHTICPWTDLMAADPTDAINGRWENGGGEGARSGLQYSLAKNFGELEFDWELRTVKMRTFGENKEAAPLLMAEISFDQLSGRKTVTGGRLSDLDFQEATSIRNDTLPESEWICVNHRGAENQALHMLGHAATGVVMLLLVPAPFFLPIFFLVLFYRTRCRRRVSNPSRMHTSSTCRF